MRLTVLATLTAIALAGPALAKGKVPAIAADTDGNGAWSWDEVVATWTEITAEIFAAADTDADGQLSPAEMKAAQAQGTLPS